MANYKLILKNTTISNIELDDGFTIPASSQITIEPSQRHRLIDDIDDGGDIVALINSGDIVVNDGVDDLILANGFMLQRAIDYIKYPDRAFNVRFEAEPERNNGFVSKNVQEAIEESRSAIEGKTAALPIFLNNGLTNNKWLSLDGAMGASNDLPQPVSFDSKIISLTYVNTNNNSDIDIEFYKNGTAPGNLVYTWSLRNKRYAYKTNNLSGVLFVAGDRLSCFARQVQGGTGVSARDVIVTIELQSTNSVVGEGGGTTL